MSQLQDRLTTVTKTQANYMLFLEDTYKKMRSEVDSKGDQAGLPASSVNAIQAGDYYITAGTKNIMKEIESDGLNSDFDNRLTNPNEKNSLMTERGLEHLIEKENDDEDLSSTIFEII
jgi:hypothetical protein